MKTGPGMLCPGPDPRPCAWTESPPSAPVWHQPLQLGTTPIHGLASTLNASGGTASGSGLSRMSPLGTYRIAVSPQ